MANYLTTDTDLTAVANAIRTKGGTSASLAFPNGFVDAIDAIETGGGVDIVKLFDRTITSISDDSIITIGSGIFRSCNRLSSVDLPNALYLGEGAFVLCSALQTLFLPKVTDTRGNGVFESAGLVTVVFPSFTGNWANANTFLNCRSLKTADIFAPYRVGGGRAFVGCTVFDTLILRKTDGIVNLDSINAFENSPFASGKAGGTLYVPQALISSYQSATNWSTILGYSTNSIQAIEGSIYETQYADGTPIT